MDKEQRDELIELAQAARGEHWCLHPNGTSVWTGEEYEPNPNHGAPQYVVCRAPLPFNDPEPRRMEFIANCSPAVILELLEFYGLSDTRIERGPEDSDEVCSVCGISTTEGHTHFECFTQGHRMGALDENIDLTSKLCEALGVQHNGYFDEALARAKLLREDAQILAELIEPIGLTERQMQALLRAQGMPTE